MYLYKYYLIWLCSTPNSLQATDSINWSDSKTIADLLKGQDWGTISKSFCKIDFVIPTTRQDVKPEELVIQADSIL